MFMPSDPMNPFFNKHNKYTLLKWACCYRFDNNRHANIHQRDKDGYNPIERYLKVLEEISKNYDEYLQEYRPVTAVINLELQKNKVH